MNVNEQTEFATFKKQLAEEVSKMDEIRLRMEEIDRLQAKVDRVHRIHVRRAKRRAFAAGFLAAVVPVSAVIWFFVGRSG